MREHPLDIFSDSFNDVEQVIWWNRYLTKLTNEKLFKNHKTFLSEEYLEIKGPYVEFVPNPKFSKNNIVDFGKELGINKLLVNAINKVLFKGDKDGHFYEHQELFIKETLTTENHLIISVPTAGGKTECFLIPIINHCLENLDEKHRLKALLFYPMRTLGSDQFERFLRYLRDINAKLETKINIAIWDGETPSNVGNFDGYGLVKIGRKFRGLVCSVCGYDYWHNKFGGISCNCGDFDWVKATRKAVERDKVDILITTPEAFDYLITDPTTERLDITCLNPDESELKYIVFDEVHCWNGIAGTNISLLIKRLQFLFGGNLQFLFSSATIKDPKELGRNLIDSKKISSINFIPEEFTGSQDNGMDFSELPPCNLNEFIETLYDLTEKQKFLKNNQISNGKNLLQYLNLLDETFQINTQNTNTNTLRKAILDIKRDVYRESKQINLLDFAQKLWESKDISNIFKKITEEKLPQIYNFRNSLLKIGKGYLKFIHQDKIISQLKKTSGKKIEQPELTLRTILTLGKLSGILSDKYHLVVRSADGIFWCSKCKLLSAKIKCSKCKGITLPLAFCKKCHEFYINLGNIDLNVNVFSNKIENFDSSIQDEIIETEEINDIDLIDEIHNEVVKVETDGLDLPSLEIPYIPDVCTTCKTKLAERNKMDGTTYIADLVSFVLTPFIRNKSDPRLLVFSDGRQSAERIGSNILSNDYKIYIMIELCKIILNTKDRSMNGIDLQDLISEKIATLYYSKLRSTDNSEIVINRITNRYNQKIRPKTYLSNMNILYRSAILSLTSIDEIKNPVEKVLAHELLISVLAQKDTFQKRSIEFRGKTCKAIFKRAQKQCDKRFLAKYDTDAFIIKNLERFIELNILKSQTKDTAFDFENIDTSNTTRDNIDQILTEITDENKLWLKELDSKIKFGETDTGIYSVYNEDGEVEYNFDFTIPSEIIFCKDCKRAWPATKNEDDYKGWICTNCGSNKIFYGNRFTNNGILPIESKSLYLEDNWGKFVLSQALNDIKNSEQYKEIYIEVHRGGIDKELRQEIEKEFKRSKSNVNILAVTTTYELGIDIGNLDTVFCMGIPPTLSNYVQRSGRCGRTSGESALVVTYTRNKNPTDEYHFRNLDQYFSDLRINYIPDYRNHKYILAQHIVTHISSYLARSSGFKQTYQKYYKNNSINLSRKAAIKEALTNFKQFYLRILIKDRREEIEKVLEETFGDVAIDVLNEILTEKQSPIFFARKLKKKIDAMNQVPTQNLSDSEKRNIRNLTSFNSFVELFSNYRGIASGLIIYDESDKKSKTRIIEKADDIRIIREYFPGEKNKKGAAFSHSFIRYKISNVISKNQRLFAVRMCENPFCNLVHEIYLLDDFAEQIKDCPLCEEEMNLYNIREPYYIGGKRLHAKAIYNTQSITGSRVKLNEEKVESIKIKSKFLTSNDKISYGEAKAHSCTPIFEHKSGKSLEWKIARSESRVDINPDEIDEDISEIFESSEFSQEQLQATIDALDSADEILEKFSPIGIIRETKALQITINRETIEEILEKKDINLSSGLPMLMFTIKQALIAAISITQSVEISDFNVDVQLLEKEIIFVIYDITEGGNGISENVMKSLKTNSDLKRKIIQTLNCEFCNNYCSRCLFLPRTNSKILRYLNGKLCLSILTEVK